MIDRDERLAAILNDLSEEKRRGHHPDVEQVANRHPNFA